MVRKNIKANVVASKYKQVFKQAYQKFSVAVAEFSSSLLILTISLTRE